MIEKPLITKLTNNSIFNLTSMILAGPTLVTGNRLSLLFRFLKNPLIFSK